MPIQSEYRISIDSYDQSAHRLLNTGPNLFTAPYDAKFTLNFRIFFILTVHNFLLCHLSEHFSHWLQLENKPLRRLAKTCSGSYSGLLKAIFSSLWGGVPQPVSSYPIPLKGRGHETEQKRTVK